jgi:hypothetical protein
VGGLILERFRFGLLADLIQRLILTRSLPLVSPFGLAYGQSTPRRAAPPVFLSARALALVAAQFDLCSPVKRNGAWFNLKRRSSSFYGSG